MFEKCRECRLTIYIFTGFKDVLRSRRAVRLVVIASGGLAPSEKTRPGILVHVSCGFCQCLSIFVDFGVPQVVLAQNDADDGDGDDKPTSAMPNSHRQANTHRDQISRSGETPSL